MSFPTIEISDQGSNALFLYEFQIDDRVWRYTAADSDVAAGGVAWEYAPIEHDRVSQSGDAEQDSVRITLPSSLTPAVAYIGSAPSQLMFVRFRKAHDGQNPAPVFFVGIVSSVDWPEPGTVVMSLVPLSTTLLREGLTQTYQRGCRHVLYSTGPGLCNVAREQYRVRGEITTTSSGIAIVEAAAALPDGWFNGGFMEWVDPVRGREWRTIELSQGNTLRMFGLTDGLYPGLEVDLYPGCPRTVAACVDKFNNLDNYGGQPHLPGNSPFDGDPFHLGG